MTKNILLVCDRSNIDSPLRRSLGHLVKSCQINIVPNGYQAYQELSHAAFDLIVIDFEIDGIDSLELVESTGYIDPGVPIVLMLKEKHRIMWSTARSLNANPILRPFKPLTFLRLIDTLLHQHLERYRELSDSLHIALDGLAAPPNHVCALLAENSGQLLMTAGDIDGATLDLLGALAAAQCANAGPSIVAYTQSEALIAGSPSEKDHDLHAASVIENLHLGLVTTRAANTFASDPWPQIQTALHAMRQAIAENTFFDETEFAADTPVASGTSKNNEPALHISIPLMLKANDKTPISIDPLPADSNDTLLDSAPVNWDIISGNDTVLNRLQNILSN